MLSGRLKQKKILLGITGSIAAYKSVLLLRLLIKEGAEVKVIMTKAAADFVSPLTFSTLSKNKILTDLYDEDAWANHVMLGRWADVMIIAPASCNTIAKMANGICDNLLQAVYLSATCPVIIAPAMDEDMWLHAATIKNITTLKNNKNIVLSVNEGELASGLTGKGRMMEPEEILSFIDTFFLKKNELAGLKALVTAGPTHEAIDPVRYIGNLSTGTMGVAIADELVARGAEVKLIIGPSNIQVPVAAEVVEITTASEMYDACIKDLFRFDIIIMAAAVADYTPENISKEKIKKESDILSVQLIKTKDILLKVGQLKKEHQTLVGFALETQNEKVNALKKLSNKNADIIVLNSLNDDGAGFGYHTNKVTIFDKKGNEFSFEKKTKTEAAKDIINTIITYRNA